MLRSYIGHYDSFSKLSQPEFTVGFSVNAMFRGNVLRFGALSMILSIVAAQDDSQTLINGPMEEERKAEVEIKSEGSKSSRSQTKAK